MLKRYAGLIVLLAIVALAMSYQLGSPLVRSHDYASTAFATIARNHVEFGLGATRGASVLRIDRDDPARSPVYAHHPFGYPLLISAVFNVLGPSEAAARLVPIVFALGTMVVLYLLLQRWFDRTTALFALGAYGFTPVNLFYGRLVSLEQPVVFFVVATTWAWYRWLESRDNRDFRVLIGLLVAGMITEWQAYYLCWLLPAHYLLVARRTAPPVASKTPPRRPASRLATIALLGPLMFGLFVAHLAWADYPQLVELRNVFWYRLGSEQSAAAIAAFGGDVTYSITEFAARLASHLWHLMLPPMLFSAAGAAVGLVWAVRRQHVTLMAASLPLLLLGPAICHTLVFHRTIYIHDCLVILYLPGIAALAGIGLRRLVVTSRLTDIRLLGAAAIVAWFLAESLGATMNLYAESSFHAAFLGGELARLTAPDDDIVVVGFRYHPAVEWYAERDVHFLDTEGDLETILEHGRPNRLVVFPLNGPTAARDDRSQDRASRLIAARDAHAREYAEQHGDVRQRTEMLLLYALPEE